MTTQAQAYAARGAAHHRALQEADAQILAAHNRHRHAQDECLRDFAREDLEQARAHKAQHDANKKNLEGLKEKRQQDSDKACATCPLTLEICQSGPEPASSRTLAARVGSRRGQG
jgi:hypothetical protein